MPLENDKPIQRTIIGEEKPQESIVIEKEFKIKNDSDIINIVDNLETNSFENTKIPYSHIVEVTEENSKTEVIAKKLENVVPPNNYDTLIKDEETLKMLHSLNFWSKFHIIIGFISAGMLFLTGLAYIFLIITIPLSIIYWIIAGISVWLLTYLYRSFNKFNELITVKTQEEFNDNVLQGLDLMKKYYKITGIFTIVSLVFAFVLIFGAIFFLVMYSSAPEFQSFLANQKTMN
jgi:cell division protein FtsX